MYLLLEYSIAAINFNQDALNALMEGNDDEEWGALKPDFATMLLATDIGEDMFGLPPQTTPALL